MRILVAGDWHSELHEEPVYRAFEKLGHEPFRFSWHQYFKADPARAGRARGIELFVRKFQNKFLVGPLIGRINRDLVATAGDIRPDLVFIYRGTHITAATLREIRRRCPGAVLVGYNNDDPFAQGHPGWLWRHFLSAIPGYDLMLAYRQSNLADFTRAGAKRVRLLRSWFIPERNHPVSLTPEDQARYGCDVVFVGHYEPDGRKELLEEVVRRGFRLRLFGHGYAWDPAIGRSPELRSQRPVRTVWGEEYNRALCGAKVALCFFSKLNRDTYTRRCFEIPATGTFMLSEYSEDAAMLFEEGAEAAYFRSGDELIQKLDRYVSDDALRQSVALAGLRRVIADGHDVVSRMQRVLEWSAEARSDAGA
ncbi:MAG: glycosyltransferase [Betaproteobacteria bacterium]|nr:glycosyltransferase [Betaproteobacteria bacterium]